MSQSSLNQLAKQEKTRREILHKSDLIPPLPDLVARLQSAVGPDRRAQRHDRGDADILQAFGQCR